MPFKKGQLAWNKGIPMPQEQRLKVSISKTGKKIAKRSYRPLDLTHKQNISKSLKGFKRPFRKRGPHSIATREKIRVKAIGRVRSEETKRKIRLARTKQIFTLETREKMKNRQINCSPEYRKKISDGMKKAMRAGKHSGWKGGITPKNEAIRKSTEMRLAREKCFKRDNYTCQKCGSKKGGDLNAHHIKLFSKYPELRFLVSNLITLCRPCHLKIKH